MRKRVILIVVLVMGMSGVFTKGVRAYTPGVDFNYMGCGDVLGCDGMGNVVANNTETCGEGWKIVCGYDQNGENDYTYDTVCSCAKLGVEEEVIPSNLCSDCYVADDGTFVARNNNCGDGLTAQCTNGFGGPGLTQCSCLTSGTIEYYKGLGESTSTMSATTHIYNPTTGCSNGVSTAFGCISYTPFGFATTFLQLIFGIAGGTAFLLMVYGFIMVATSSGDEKKLQGARETITSAIIGLLICIFALFLFRLVAVNILQIPGLS